MFLLVENTCTHTIIIIIAVEGNLCHAWAVIMYQKIVLVSWKNTYMQTETQTIIIIIIVIAIIISIITSVTS